MGYRSDVQMLVSGPEGKVDELMSWIKIQKDEESRQPSQSFYSLEFMWECLIDMYEDTSVRHSYTTKHIVFQAESFKAYDPWDSVVEAVHKYCDEHDLSFAYGRLGENIEDAEVIDNGKGLYIHYSRKFDDPFSNY